MSQFGGPGRTGGGGGFGGDDGGDDRDFPPFGEHGDETGRFGPGRQFEYRVEERYWTDYLRIALPVLGVIILLGLVWFWVASLLGDPDDENNDVTPDVSGPVIVDDTPTPDDQNGDDAQEPPVTVTTPTPPPTDDESEAPVAEIAPGATVVVANTGGSGLNMRAAPSTSAEIQEELSDGAQLTITGEAVEAEGFTWWPVESATSTGFVVADFIELSN